MPHVVINGNIPVQDIFEKLEDGIIKSSEIFISQNKTTMIVKTLVIEKENKASFFVQVKDRDDGVVIRLYPDFDIPKAFRVKNH